MPNRVPAVRYIAARRSSMRTLSSSDSPFHYVMAKIVPVVQLAAHAKSSTLYGPTVVQPNFFSLMGYYYFV